MKKGASAPLRPQSTPCPLIYIPELRPTAITTTYTLDPTGTTDVAMRFTLANAASNPRILTARISKQAGATGTIAVGIYSDTAGSPDTNIIEFGLSVPSQLTAAGLPPPTLINFGPDVGALGETTLWFVVRFVLGSGNIDVWADSATGGAAVKLKILGLWTAASPNHHPAVSGCGSDPI